MLPKYRKKEYILDKLHRGFVNICIGTTVITGIAIMFKVYEYVRYIRPMRQAEQLQIQAELLAEGKPIQGVLDKTAI